MGSDEYFSTKLLFLLESDGRTVSICRSGHHRSGSSQMHWDVNVTKKDSVEKFKNFRVKDDCFNLRKIKRFLINNKIEEKISLEMITILEKEYEIRKVEMVHEM